MERLGWTELPRQGSVFSRPPRYAAHRWKDRQAPKPAPLPLLPPHCPLPFPSSDTADCGRASVLESSNREGETTRPTAHSERCLNQAPSPMGHVHPGQASSGEESSLT